MNVAHTKLFRTVLQDEIGKSSPSKSCSVVEGGRCDSQELSKPSFLVAQHSRLRPRGRSGRGALHESRDLVLEKVVEIFESRLVAYA